MQIKPLAYALNAVLLQHRAVVWFAWMLIVVLLALVANPGVVLAEPGTGGGGCSGC